MQIAGSKFNLALVKSFTIVGAGRAGGALALALIGAGFSLDALIKGKPSLRSDLAKRLPPETLILSLSDATTISSDLLFIAVPDDQIKVVAERLAASVQPGIVAFHLSGAIGSDTLNPIADRGADIGSLHPLVSIADPISGVKTLRSGYFGIEGTDRARRIGSEIARKIGSGWFEITADKKPLYHTAAVLAAGHLVALLDAAFEVIERAIDPDSPRFLLPLVKSVIENLENTNTETSLTGPLARGDAKTVERHLKALTSSFSANLANIYISLAERSVEIARRGGDSETLKSVEILEELNIAKRHLA
ncbi:MAG: hypothetical protein C4324_06015 [Blastocatellia bacterium]